MLSDDDKSEVRELVSDLTVELEARFRGLQGYRDALLVTRDEVVERLDRVHEDIDAQGE